jgi:Mg-chelatase subunit ChlD
LVSADGKLELVAVFMLLIVPLSWGDYWSVSMDGNKTGISSLTAVSGTIYAGQAGGAGDGDVFVYSVYNGSVWSKLYDGSGSRIAAMDTGDDDRLYISDIADTRDCNIRSYNGSAWQVSLSSASSGLCAYSIKEYTDLFAGGIVSGTNPKIYKFNLNQNHTYVNWSISYAFPPSSASQGVKTLDYAPWGLCAGLDNGAGDLGASILCYSYNLTNSAYEWSVRRNSAESVNAIAQIGGGKMYAATNNNILYYNGSGWINVYDSGAYAMVHYNRQNTFRVYAGIDGGIISLNGSCWTNSSKWDISYSKPNVSITSFGVLPAVYYLTGKNEILFAGQSGNNAGDGDILMLNEEIEPSSTTTKIHAVKAALNTSIDTVTSRGINMGLVAFTGYPYYPGGIFSQHGMSSDAASLKQQVSLYEHADGTCISCGVNNATNLLNGSTGEKYMVIISDGIPQSCMPSGALCNNSHNMEEVAKEDARQMVSAASTQGIKVYTIAIGVDQSYTFEADYTLMTELAALGGGKAYKAACKTALETVMQDISENEVQDNVVYVTDVSGTMEDDYNLACGTTTTTTSSTSTSSSTSSTSSSTTTTQVTCQMPGNTPPCETIALSEVVSAINAWAVGDLNLGEVIDMINSWADPISHQPN